MSSVYRSLNPSYIVLDDDKEADKAGEKVPKFKVQPLSGELAMELAEEQGDDGSFRGKDFLFAARHGLVGWKNVTDENKQPVEFKDSETAIRHLSVNALVQIGKEVIFLTFNTDEQVKKS